MTPSPLTRWRTRRRDDPHEAASQVSSAPLAELLRAPAVDDATEAGALELLALDFETTGLNPARDEIISMGWLPVTGEGIDLSGGRHLIVRSDREVGESATIHGLTDDDIAGGLHRTEAMDLLYQALRGRVLLAHYAPLELGFIAAETDRLHGVKLRLPAIDTLELGYELTTRRGQEPAPGSLRLWTARARYGLPHYRAHNALTDALACAELYLGQVAEMTAKRSGQPPTLADLLSR